MGSEMCIRDRLYYDHSPQRAQRGKRRQTPMADRAARVGVSHELKALPRDAPPPDAPAEVVRAYQRTLRAVQKANQQVVSRAEEQQAAQRQQEREAKMRRLQLSSHR